MSDITFYYSYSLSCHFSGGQRGLNSLLCGWVAWGCALPPVNGPVTLMRVSVCCSFWIRSWTLFASLDKQLPAFGESSSEPRTRAASLTSPDWSSTWRHTFMNVSSHSVHLLKDHFLTVCKISADPLRVCREETAKLTKRLMISKVDNDGCCCGGDSRVITDCKEPTGRGGFKAANRTRRWSNASLACTWKHTRQIKRAVNWRMNAVAFFPPQKKKKKRQICNQQMLNTTWCDRSARWERRQRWWGLREEADTEETVRWNSDQLARHSLGKSILHHPF